MSRVSYHILIFLGIILTSYSHTHSVRSGDTLWNISQRYNTTVPHLKKINSLSSNTIIIGQQIKVPSTQKSSKKSIHTVPSPRTVKTSPKKLWYEIIERIPSIPILSDPINLTPRTQQTVKAIPWIAALPRAEKRTSSFYQPKPLAKPVEISITDRIRVEKKETPSPFMKNLALQVQLDRAGFSPGVIDGKAGHFTSLAEKICPESKINRALSPTQSIRFEPTWQRYVDHSLPLDSLGHPNFTNLSSKKTPLMYSSISEMIAERYHCKVALLKQLNPSVDFNRLLTGEILTVPNVESFQIERYYSTATHEGLWTGELGQGSGAHQIIIDKKNKLLTLWNGNRIVRAYPVTLNERATPISKRTVDLIAPGPLYKKKKTGLTLEAGPNSPVGIVWNSIGGGYGIHGTNNPDQIGRNSSSGCIRLANWDAVRLSRQIRKGTAVQIIEGAQYVKQTSDRANSSVTYR